MRLNWLKPTASAFTTRSPCAWKVAWGRISTVQDSIAWCDDQFAIVQLNSTLDPESMYCLSPTGRFVIVGDVWLTNPSALQQTLEISEPQAFLQLVAHLWEQSGSDTFQLLTGMFALMVWDREQKMLYGGRDRCGSRTLYYSNSGSTCWLAPNLRALAPHRSNELDLVAMRDYLCCAFVPGERTLWQQIKEIRPGTFVTFPGQHKQEYWQLAEQITASDEPLTWHGQQLRSSLSQVIQESLPQRESVGVFLSGGLDSSSVTALATQLHNYPVHTFSIHFGDSCPNELAFSSCVAQHCQTQHHILEITFQQMWEKLPETMAYLDDPIGDPLTVPNLLVGEFAQQFVRVALNGEGGDPCFGGPKNQPMLMNRLYRSVHHQNALEAYLASFQKCTADLPRLLKPEVWTSVQTAPWAFSDDLYSDASYLNRLMMLNIKFKGADQILTKVNNLTQAAGLHGRSPLFDQRIVELSMQIPPEYKLSGVEEKAVLKQSVADLLPAEIIHRPKSGMMVPVQLGFRDYWNRQARSLLLSRNAAIAPYLNQSLIREWLDYRGDTWGRYGVKLWLLVSLELWLQVNQKIWRC